ncbi:MAG: DUF3489 domain-containing protein [Bryobacteraceae bacterium]|jgi:hypothetical protein
MIHLAVFGALASQSPRIRPAPLFPAGIISFHLPFRSNRAIHRPAQPRAEKDIYHMTTAETNTPDKAAAVAAQGAHVAPEKAPAKKPTSQKKGAPKAKKSDKGAKAKAAPEKAAAAGAKANKQAAKPTAAKKAAAPRAESKGAKILEMIARAKGATFAEIMRATDWRAHSVGA